MKRRWSPLLVLLALDLACIGLHLAQSAGWLRSKTFMLERDNGWAERYQYAKALAVAVLLWRRAGRGAAVLRVWSLMFLFFAADDAFRLHERMGGAWLGGKLAMDHGYDYGQVLYAGAVASGFGLALHCFWRRAEEASRRTSWRLVMAVALLGGAGVGVDFIHSVFNPARLEATLVLLEDGGELVAMSLALWVVLTPAPPRPEPSAP